MNKIHKIVSNKKTGQKIVVSELTKGKTKSSRLKQISLSAITTIAAISGNYAHAVDCNISITGNESIQQSCTTTGTDNINAHMSATGDVTMASAGTAFVLKSQTGNISFSAEKGSHIQTVNPVGGHDGIYAQSAGGNIDIDLSGTIIGSSLPNTGFMSYGVIALARTDPNYNLATLSAGDITINASSESNINIPGRGVGLLAYNGTGHVDIVNEGTIYIEARTSGGGGGGGIGIYGGQGTNRVVNKGSITVLRSGAEGLSTVAEEGSMDLINEGTIHIGDANQSYGTNSHGMYIAVDRANAKDLKISNSNSITTEWKSAHGILVESVPSGTSNSLEINNSGIIKTGVNTNSTETGLGKAIFLDSINSDQTDVFNSGILLAEGATEAVHITSNAANNGNITLTNTNDITLNTRGQNGWTVSAQTANGVLTINNSGRITGQGAGGIYAESTGTGAINIYNSGTILANGSNAGVALNQVSANTLNHTIHNSGTINALNDEAINLTASNPGSTVTINNYGTITGYITGSLENAIFNNYSSNSWNIQNFYDSNADGVKDTKGVAISNYGAGYDVVNNASTGTIRLSAAPLTYTSNNTGEYVPVGALSTLTSGIVQGQLLNLEEFNNSGAVLLTENGLAGDTLIITGAATAGGYGGGKYTSNGGSLALDTVLNNGGTNSLSDISMVDDAVLGTGATRIFVKATANSTGGLTSGDGIKLVEATGTLDPDSFVLGTTTTYGIYEYKLNLSGQNLYLINNIGGKVFTSPVIGAYLGNQHVALNMFEHNIKDRRDAVHTPDSNIWMRLNHNKASTDMVNNQLSTDMTTTSVQIGANLGRWNDHHFGVYGGYGNSKIDSSSKTTGSIADGKVSGYNIGVYNSWIPNETNHGVYVDTWGQYSWFNNKLTGKSQNFKETKYDSSAITLSAEVGYSIPFAQTENKKWLVEPHAQATYTWYNTDDFTDQNSTLFSGAEGDGFKSRLGARIYGQGEAGIGISPFVEANWIYDGSNRSVSLSKHNVDSNVAKNIGEIKVGFEGRFNKNLSAWAHVGGRKGNNSYERIEGQLGLGYNW